MTKEELIELNKVMEENYQKCRNAFDYSFDYSVSDGMVVRISELSAVIDFIRKDLKKIVADAVKSALANHTEKPCPDAQEKQKVMYSTDNTGKHPITGKFNQSIVHTDILKKVGVTYYEDIQGYDYITTSDGTRYSLEVNGEDRMCPMDFCVADLVSIENAMVTLGLPFELKKDTHPLKRMQVKDKNGKHPLDTAAFNYKSTRQLLDSYGIHYLEDIKGYISGNLAESTVPIISIGEFPNGILKPIPVDNFEDIGVAMQSNNIPFKRI